MMILNGKLFGILVSALLAIIWHLSVCPTLAEERNSTTKTATSSNYSTESIPNNATKPYPQIFDKPYPRTVAPKPSATAERGKSTRPNHRLNSKANKKKHKFYQRTTKGKITQGHHYEKFSKRKQHKKISKHHHRPPTKERATTVTANDISTKVAGEYYYEEYYVDVTSTRSSTTQMVSHQDGYTSAIAGKKRIKENYDAVTKFGFSNELSGVSTSEEPVPRLIEYESFGRIASGVTRASNAGYAISIMMVLSSSVKFMQIVS